jgi:hypothetical protein
MRYRLTLSLAFLCFNWRVQIFNYFRLTRCQRTMDLGWMNMKQPLQNPVSGSLRKLGQTPFRSVMVFPHKVERCEFFLWLVSSNKRNAKSWGGQIYAIKFFCYWAVFFRSYGRLVYYSLEIISGLVKLILFWKLFVTVSVCDYFSFSLF